MQYIHLPSGLTGFRNSMTTIEMAQSGREVYLLHGELERGKVSFCPACGQKMHIHGSRITMLRHLCFGSRLSAVSFEKRRYCCPCCGHTEMERVPFKADGHNITRELLQFTRELLAYGFTNKGVSELTGLGKNTVKEIDLQRLKDKYTVDGKTLIRPEKQARFLGVDEFKLHNGYKYASLIIDMESGHILWLAHGKRKRTVYDFIDHVGEAWMDGVEAVACDMNSDFQEAFEERCPHIQPVFDYFHLVKNFNEKVVGAIRKDEQRRLADEENTRAAAALKKTKYILTSSKTPCAARTRKPLRARSSPVVENYSLSLLLPANLAMTSGTRSLSDKTSFSLLWTSSRTSWQAPTSRRTRRPWRRKYPTSWTSALLRKTSICSGSVVFSTSILRALLPMLLSISPLAGSRGSTTKSRPLRRKGYGYPDDDYFFLKLFDVSRKPYIRNPSSHNFYD